MLLWQPLSELIAREPTLRTCFIFSLPSLSLDHLPNHPQTSVSSPKHIALLGEARILQPIACIQLLHS
jgi:hypothetical protein